ncbi:bifunctional metallophosphatase/5'-nucleotidase [Fictibacillus sp. 18YEL24]|uniref:bifunctional metallophosphatase/5'-nucleotidase n=1 Tax=Fictibacillus sp. 18YEL24 TaxID=2745875 RepID=UPI0018CD41B5|nr:bifunctional UDP-sugar hydrolase/5'-nucleotidase [Fictibacillus sp. 18YEL24]MBH0168900.1 bifunctional metallophosphatase/5'-nucleotidase [Fictibacillus sp. 18YEL24]
MEQSIHIYVTSDIHGYVLPLTYANNEKADIGLAKMAALIKENMSNHLNTFLIDNGDLIQGTPLTYYHAKTEQSDVNPMVHVLNELNYDAAIIGNHEFNYGLPYLYKTIEESKFPWLSANIVHQGTEKPVFGQPYVIKTFECGIKVALLGLTTQYVPNWENPDHIKGLSFLDAVETAKKWVPYLRSKSDVMIVSYHGGFERDLRTGKPTESLTKENQAYQLCMEVEGIDVLLTGHQHRLLEGEVNFVTIIMPGTQGTEIGYVEIKVHGEGDSWKVKNKRAKLISVSEYKPDQQVLDLIQPYESETQKWLDQALGQVDGDMTITDPMLTRLSDHPFIEFINKVQMEAAGVDISSTALFDDHSKGFSKHITMRDIVSNYVYPNTLKVIEITGRDMKDALERSASYFSVNEEGDPIINPAFSIPKPQHYNYDMWEGIDYVIDLSKPIGHRIVTLMYKGKPIENDSFYEVVMNNYRAGGGGDYPMFKGKRVVKDIPIDMSELMANYILKRGTIQATCDHNWRVEISSFFKK